MVVCAAPGLLHPGREPAKTHNLVFLAETLELDLPDNQVEPLIIISRSGVASRYPHNLEELLE